MNLNANSGGQEPDPGGERNPNLNPGLNPNLYSPYAFYAQNVNQATDPGMSQLPMGPASTSQGILGGPHSHLQGQPTMMTMPMMYGASSLPYGAPQMMTQQLYPPIQQQMMSPGALARQQRAHVDSKRGKRRRNLPEASVSGSMGITESSMQIVPGDGSGVPQAEEGPVSAIKEERRKKRLLRNRVSAQQARERKRQHMVELEEKCEQLVKSNSELELQIEDLSKENEELRRVVRNNMRGKPSPVSASTSLMMALEESSEGPDGD